MTDTAPQLDDDDIEDRDTFAHPRILEAVRDYLDNVDDPAALFYLGVTCALFSEISTPRAAYDLALLDLRDWLAADPVRDANADRLIAALWPDVDRVADA